MKKSITFIPLLAMALTACKEDVPVTRNSQVSFEQEDRALFARSSKFDFAWKEGLDDLNPDSEVLARGIWREPDGDIVTCTDWHGDMCVETRESDDGLDVLEGLGLVALGAAAGYSTKKVIKPKSVSASATTPRTIAPKPAPATRATEPSKPVERKGTSTLSKPKPKSTYTAPSKSRTTKKKSRRSSGYKRRR